MRAITKFWHWFKEAETLDSLLGWWATKALVTGLFTGVAVVSGFIEGIPFTYLWVAGIITASTSVTALIRLDEWRKRTNLKGKFRSLGYNFTWNPAPGIPLRILEGGVILNVENISDYEIEFEVVNIHEVLNDRTSSILGDGIIGEVYTILPKTESKLGFNAIRLDFDPPGQISGVVDVSFKFGRSGGERRFTLRRKFNITIDTYQNGTLSTRGLEIRVPFKSS